MDWISTKIDSREFVKIRCISFLLPQEYFITSYHSPPISILLAQESVGWLSGSLGLEGLADLSGLVHKPAASTWSAGMSGVCRMCFLSLQWASLGFFMGQLGRVPRVWVWPNKASCVQLQNWLILTSATFHWPKQVIRPVQAQGWGKRQTHTVTSQGQYFVRFILSFSFWGTNINGVVFLISNSTCLLLVYRKRIGFYILTFYPTTLL